MKIKLIAIAKDEAAYLPEWIYHHLNVGFDAITVLTNGISDNTHEVLSKISKHYPVEDINVDYISTCITKGFQRMAYGIELERSKNQGFTHVMFLDIDEFWVASDFKVGIKEFLISKGSPEIMSFPWLLSQDEKDYQLSFCEINKLAPATHVKTILSTSVNISELHVHGFVSNDASCIYVDGNTLAMPGEYVAKIDREKSKNQPAFIMHRMTRGQKEYISMLARGNPDNADAMKELKLNRNGYLVSDKNAISWVLDANEVEEYTKNYTKFIESCGLQDEIDLARAFINTRFDKVVDFIRTSNSYPKSFLKKILKNVTIPSVINAYKENFNVANNIDYVLPDISDLDLELLTRRLEVDNAFVDSLRDIALEYKNNDIKISLQLLKIAHMFRPEGPTIKYELIQTQKLLKAKIEDRQSESTNNGINVTNQNKKIESDFNASDLNHILEVDNNFVNYLRDSAISYKTIDLKLSFQLMKLASLLRPSGEFIRNELSEISNLLSIGVEKISMDSIDDNTNSENKKETPTIDVNIGQSVEEMPSKIDQQKAPLIFWVSLFLFILSVLIVSIL